jgi:hypothetical protein
MIFSDIQPGVDEAGNLFTCFIDGAFGFQTKLVVIAGRVAENLGEIR